MPKYENSIIYKLCHCNDLENNNIYVGSTTNFTRRKNKHKNSCYYEKNKNYNSYVYHFIRENGNWNEWVMIPIEVYPCNNKKELEVRERYYIELLKSKLNQKIPTRSKKEYRNDNKEKIAEYDKQYYETNKEIILEKAKEYYKSNKEQIKEKTKQYQNANKEIISEMKKQHYETNKEILLEKKKQYQNANKEKITTKDKKYYENNKEIILEKKKEKVICDHCGCEITKGCLKRHQKTKKCIDSI